MLCVYTDQDDLTEREFLKREVSFELKRINPSEHTFDLLSRKGKLWIATTRPELWSHIISNSPANSIVFLYLGNELYDTSHWDGLRSQKSIFQYFQYAPVNAPRFSNLLSAYLASLLDSGPTFPCDFIHFTRNLRTGLQLLKRLKRAPLSDGEDTHEIPQGYSVAFVSQLSRLVPSLNSDDSLLDNVALIQNYSTRENFEFDVGFVGQSGNLRRTRVLDLTRSARKMKIFLSVRDFFQGNNADIDLDYLLCLIKSKFCLVPPGHFNNYNHRYCEALLVNRLPIVSSNNLTDPNTNYYWPRKYPFVLRDSYRWLLYKALRLDTLELSKTLQKAQEVEFHRLNEFRMKIKKCQEI